MNNLKQLKNEEIINLIKKGIVTVSDIVDSEICPTCFDKNNKYQPNKMSKLLEMITYTSLMSEKYQNTKILEKAQKRAYDMIFTYFEDNTDKEGKLTINPELPKKYVQKRSLSDTKNKAERVL